MVQASIPLSLTRNASDAAMRRMGLIPALFGLALALISPALADGESADFLVWLDGMRARALADGVSERTVAATLGDIALSPRVLALDQRQPEFVQTFWRYLDARVTPARIERGQELLTRYATLLADIQQRFGVAPRFLVALWGMETDFGGDTGNFDVAQSLATLAFDGRRSALFTEQLLALLHLIDRGDVAVGARGSWAGAMGEVQFMPTTYRDYGVDEDGDGRCDLWGSLPDALASAANFLVRSGWHADETWGREVSLPPGFDLGTSGPEITRPLAQWQAMGVRRVDGGDLPAADMSAALLLPAGVTGPALLVYNNFNVILNWNHSLLYAVAVGHLADRLIGEAPFAAARPPFEESLSRSDLMEVQVLLARLGFDAGQPDGVLGSKTRTALQSFQRSNDLPADGYPSAGVIERLRTVGTP
jgi:membrane-bound lytic murein transglycosylase B